MKQPIRYILTDRFGATEVVPLNVNGTTIKSSNASEDALRDYEQEFDGALMFDGLAFSRLLRIEKSIYRCTEQYLSIQRLCTNTGVAVYKEIYKGVILLNNCVFDEVNCTIEVKFKKDTEYKCIEDSSREKTNIITAFESVEVDVFQKGVTLETVECSGTVFGEGPHNLPFCGAGTAFAQSYLVMESNQKWQEPKPGPGNIDQWQYVYYVKWAREAIELDCNVIPDFGWNKEGVCVNGKQKWVRFPTLTNCERNISYDVINKIEEVDVRCKSMLTGGNAKLRNGQRLDLVLKRLVTDKCGYPIKSNFFQINPTEPSEINYVTGDRSTTNNVIIFQKSDVKRPLDVNTATKGETTFVDLMDALNFFFNVGYRLINGVVEIEHITFFGKNEGIDLTQEQFKHDMSGVMRYSYKNEDVPASETWRLKEGSPGAFSEQIIYYPSNCVVDRTITTEYLQSDFMTDVSYCFDNSDSNSDKVEDRGFVIVSTRRDGNSYYISGPKSASTSSNINAVFSIAELIKDFHYYERPLISGSIDSQIVEFFSSKPIKKGETISIPLCCGMEFNPNDTIKTKLGIGVVDSASFNIETNMLELDLLYNENADLTPNTPPTTGSISKRTYLNEPIVINMLEAAFDAEGILHGFELVTQPRYGTAEKISDTEILYTPLDVGGDYFQFFVFDEWNEKSNTATCTIDVRQDNVPPVANDDYYNMFNDSPTTISAANGLFKNDHGDNGFELKAYDQNTTLGGSVVVQDNGAFTYTPPSGDILGVDTFTYTIEDDRQLSDTATCYITLQDRNEIITTDKAFITWKGYGFNNFEPQPNDNLLKGDHTLNGDAVTCVPETVTTLGRGTAKIYADGRFEYTPNPTYVGVDRFNYQATFNGRFKSQEVRVNVVNNVFVKMETKFIETVQLTDICNGQTVAAGSETRSETIAYFYINAERTIPINMDGFGLKMYYRTKVNDIYQNYEEDRWSRLCSGTSTVIVDNFISYRHQVDCFNSVVSDYREEHTLLFGQGYEY